MGKMGKTARRAIKAIGDLAGTLLNRHHVGIIKIRLKNRRNNK
jgi:hypothetical protein